MPRMSPFIRETQHLLIAEFVDVQGFTKPIDDVKCIKGLAYTMNTLSPLYNVHVGRGCLLRQLLRGRDARNSHT